MGMYAKYQMFFLAVAMLLFSAWNRTARRAWWTAGPYLALVVALGLFVPHLWWAWQNDFPTVSYAMDRTQGSGNVWAHVTGPLEFLAAQLLAVGPILLFAVPLVGCCHPWYRDHSLWRLSSVCQPPDRCCCGPCDLRICFWPVPLSCC